MAKVSIIVPVYNVEKYLDKCLQSLINQTLKDIEIICVNDGSTDNSLEILERYAKKDSRIIIINQENQGLSGARNSGLKKANGEYIGFVDSDDWVDLNFFEKLYNSAVKYNCEIACAGFKRCGKFFKSARKKYTKEQVYTQINDKIIADKIPYDNYVWNKIYKREALKEFSFPIGRNFEDIAVTVKIVHKLKNMVTVPETYYNYRKNQSSIINSQSSKKKEDFNWALNELLSYAKENNIKLPERNDCYKKENIFIFGIKILKVYYYENKIKYKLFGCIDIFKKEISF